MKCCCSDPRAISFDYYNNLIHLSRKSMEKFKVAVSRNRFCRVSLTMGFEYVRTLARTIIVGVGQIGTSRAKKIRNK